MLVFVQGSAEPVSSADLKVPDLLWHVDRCGQWAQRRGLSQGSVRSMAVVEGLELAERVQKVSLVPVQGVIQQLTSARLYPALHEGVHPRYPDAGGDDVSPASASMASKAPVNFESRSRIKNLVGATSSAQFKAC
jgi:hypothetical protein